MLCFIIHNLSTKPQASTEATKHLLPSLQLHKWRLLHLNTLKTVIFDIFWFSVISYLHWLHVLIKISTWDLIRQRNYVSHVLCEYKSVYLIFDRNMYKDWRFCQNFSFSYFSFCSAIIQKLVHSKNDEVLSFEKLFCLHWVQIPLETTNFRWC